SFRRPTGGPGEEIVRKYAMMMGTSMRRLRSVPVVVFFLVGCAAQPRILPARYFRLMEAGLPAVERRLAAEPNPDLETPEATPAASDLPYSILAAAVLYTSSHPANVSRGDPRWLALALRIGNLLASKSEGQRDVGWLSHRELYLWIETFRLLEQHL